jgi:glutamate dehydrogenase (NADP+)
VLAHEGDSIEGKLIAVSGYDNAGWGIMKTAMQPGAMVIAASGVKYDIEVANMLTTNDALTISS